MSHLDYDESQDWHDDIDSFERQLRSLHPSPPTQTWDSIAESNDASLDQPQVVLKLKPTISVWRTVISHSVTAVIGVAVGVSVMLTSPLDNSTTGSTQVVNPPIEGNAAVELTNRQNPANLQPFNADRETPDSLATTSDASPLRIQQADRRSQRFARTALRSGPLRAFDSISESGGLRRTERIFDSGQSVRRRNDQDDEDSATDRADDLFLDKPALSPRSLHLFIDELT